MHIPLSSIKRQRIRRQKKKKTFICKLYIRSEHFEDDARTRKLRVVGTLHKSMVLKSRKTAATKYTYMTTQKSWQCVMCAHSSVIFQSDLPRCILIPDGKCSFDLPRGRMLLAIDKCAENKSCASFYRNQSTGMFSNHRREERQQYSYMQHNTLRTNPEMMVTA